MLESNIYLLSGGHESSHGTAHLDTLVIQHASYTLSFRESSHHTLCYHFTFNLGVIC